MSREAHVRFCEGLGLQCPGLLTRTSRLARAGSISLRWWTLRRAAVSAGRCEKRWRRRLPRARCGWHWRATEVLLPSLGRSELTTSDGTFEIGGLSAGAIAVIIRGPGYQPHFARVVLPLSDSPGNFTLEQLPQSLQPVTVTASRDVRSFEERRAVGSGGSYLSRQELAARETSRLSDILRSVRGIRIVRRPDGANIVISPRGYFSRSVRDCPYQIILDGQRLFALRAGDSLPPAIDDFAPAHLEGIEIYAGPATTQWAWGRMRNNHPLDPESALSSLGVAT